MEHTKYTLAVASEQLALAGVKHTVIAGNASQKAVKNLESGILDAIDKCLPGTRVVIQHDNGLPTDALYEAIFLLVDYEKEKPGGNLGVKVRIQLKEDAAYSTTRVSLVEEPSGVRHTTFDAMYFLDKARLKTKLIRVISDFKYVTPGQIQMAILRYIKDVLRDVEDSRLGYTKKA